MHRADAHWDNHEMLAPRSTMPIGISKTRPAFPPLDA